MNQEMYRDTTADRAVRLAEKEQRRERQARTARMRRAQMVYVILPALDGCRDEAAGRMRAAAAEYVLCKGRIPCLNECHGLADAELDGEVQRIRGLRLMNLCAEVWVFGSREGEYTKKVQREIREAGARGKKVRSIYLSALKDAGRQGAQEMERA